MGTRSRARAGVRERGGVAAGQWWRMTRSAVSPPTPRTRRERASAVHLPRAVHSRTVTSRTRLRPPPPYTDGVTTGFRFRGIYLPPHTAVIKFRFFFLFHRSTNVHRAPPCRSPFSRSPCTAATVVSAADRLVSRRRSPGRVPIVPKSSFPALFNYSYIVNIYV